MGNMERFPFFSVDNSDWVLGGKIHQLRLFEGRAGRPNPRPVYRTLQYWEDRAEAAGYPTNYIGQMLGFEPDQRDPGTPCPATIGSKNRPWKSPLKQNTW